MSETKRPFCEGCGAIGGIEIDVNEADPSIKRVFAHFVVNADEALPVAVAIKQAVVAVFKQLGIPTEGMVRKDTTGIGEAFTNDVPN